MKSSADIWARREICRWGFFAVFGFATGGCGGANFVLPQEDSEEMDVLLARNHGEKSQITLRGSEQRIARATKRSFDLLQDAAKTPGREIEIRFRNGKTWDTLVLTFATKEAGIDYLHPRLTLVSTGETVHLAVGEKNFLPSLKLIKPDGSTLAEVGVSDLRRWQGSRDADRKKLSTADLIALGVKIAAIALGIYLAAVVVKVIIGAIAFIAFNAFVLGLLLAAGAVVIPLVKKLLAFLGISNTEEGIRKIKEFFAQGVDVVVKLFQDIARFLE